VAEFLGRDVEQQVFPAWIVFGETLGEVSHRSGELAIRPAELLQNERGEHRIRLGDADGILKPLVVHKH
jgi:hypothetical protein